MNVGLVCSVPVLFVRGGYADIFYDTMHLSTDSDYAMTFIFVIVWSDPLCHPGTCTNQTGTSVGALGIFLRRPLLTSTLSTGAGLYLNQIFDYVNSPRGCSSGRC